MKLRFTNEWLRQRIESDKDVDTEAGIPIRDGASIAALVPPETAADTKAASEPRTAVLNVLVHQLRRRDGLTVDQLAQRIRVDAAELEQIETTPSYVPRPRTMHMLATYMNVSTQAVQSLTADAISRNDNMAQAALKFAASSKDLSALTNTERQGLNDFVKFLANYKD